MTLQTEFPFTLPRGYLDPEGNLHREGVMVNIANRTYERALGDLTHINPKVIEGLFSADLAFLQDFYQRINQNGHSRAGITCPHCEAKFDVELNHLGE